jgi:2-phospho-L-lactate guanylyltransferase
MRETWAVLPVKSFDRAKTRLRPVLTESQCASIARLMAIDMLKTLTAVAAVDRILLLGQGSDQAELAERFGCEYADDDPALDISRNLDQVYAGPAVATADRALYRPGDMPHVRPGDIQRLLAWARDGITICRAARDGGSNATVACPPRGMHFSLGSGSAARHASAAKAERTRVEIVDDPAFQRDVDVPQDLAWLCRIGINCTTVDYLRETGLDALVRQMFPEALAS